MSMMMNIFSTWRRPRSVMRALLAEGPREDRALASLIGALVLMFVAQWPQHARAAHLDPSVPLEARIAGALMAVLFILPLAAYAVAALSHLVARVFGGHGSFWGTRRVLFWTLLALSPIVLFQGLVAGLIGPGAALSLVQAVAALSFVLIWGAGLRVAEFEAI
jgi:hypothetical protein